ncbi:arylsulfatase [Paludisphaera mucosa]|uniref:Arylsulfatase n=1 Tax=Paludisphaera mucosa TaxID=3030827 RepID=A0ABT6FEN5_9BACT|nr:arylsulfatase [Paludisphaera mucosa]MDG3006038.1 arylsulfatase [Paludisphaera mucosa]
MTSIRGALVAGLVVLGWAGHGAAMAADGSRPNIVLILSDDMGYSDLGCYGGELTTPNLDGLAAGGVRFTQFYNTARCCPTRASLLTGLYPHQAGMGHMTNDRGHDGYRGVLNRNAVTIAEVLRPAGYGTYMVGKWHVTRFVGPNGDRATWPLGRGFDKYYGTIIGAGSYFDPGNLCRQETLITPENDPEYKPESFYYTDAISDNAVKYLRDHKAATPEKPFFLYVAYTAAHWPMHASEKDVARYAGKYDTGYAPVREGRFKRMKELGLIPADAELTPASDDWKDVDDKAREARCKEVYAAMVESMDAGVGRIVAQLKESGQLENTLILYLQDNGACAEVTGREQPQQPVEGLKPLGPDEVQLRGGPPMQTRDGRQVRTGPGVMPGPADTFVAYGRGWANVSNTPFREYKHWTHEGGVSTPLVAHWPKGIGPERKGKLEPQPGHLIDVMATCVDVAGAAYPAEVDGRPIKPREGVSLRPAFQGEPLGRTQPLFWEHEGNRAVRDGDWKLVARANEPWELYNIAEDRSELHDLAAKHPDRAKALADAWDAYAARANVLPLGAWRDDANQDPPSRERRFELKADSELRGRTAPHIEGRPLAVTAKVTTRAKAPDGVIVAHGGTAAGFSLFVEDARPTFLVRSGAGRANTARIIGPELAPGEHNIIARLDQAGRLTLDVDGQAAEPVAGRLISRQPADGLQVGRDANAPVGPYGSPNAFKGTIESVVVEIGE